MVATDLASFGVKLLLMSVPPYLDTCGGWIGASWQPGAPIKIDTMVSLLVVVGLLVLSVVSPSRAPAATASASQTPSGEQRA